MKLLQGVWREDVAGCMVCRCCRVYAVKLLLGVWREVVAGCMA